MRILIVEDEAKLAGDLYSRRKLGSIDEEDDEDFIFTSPESS